MPEIHYKAFLAHLKENKGKGVSPVCLIYGEELLYRKALEALVDFLIPESSRIINYDPIDDTEVSIFEAIERINTFSLLPGIKLFALHDSRIFASKQDEKKLLEKSKAAYDENDLPKAARHLASVMGVLNISFKDIEGENGRDIFGIGGETTGTDDQWLDKVVMYCVENGISAAFGGDSAGALQRAIEKGFPPGHHLVITTDTIDKRKNLYKTIKQVGTIVDCSVAKGDRKAARTDQEAVIRDQMNAMLAGRGKTITGDAYQAMYGMTGFDLHTFTDNLEKLISYIGTRKQIVIEDIEGVLKRTKIDPIYELTGAISDRNAERAIFYLNSLLSTGHHPLQMLGAIINQMRRMLLIKGFVESPAGRVWQRDLPYTHFTGRIMPQIQDSDRGLVDQLKEWNHMLSNKENAGIENSRPKKRTNVKPNTDLMMAKNPKNTYPVYQMLKKSDRFSKTELFDAFECLTEADLLLKSSGPAPKLILENVILTICRFAT